MVIFLYLTFTQHIIVRTYNALLVEFEFSRDATFTQNTMMLVLLLVKISQVHDLSAFNDNVPSFFLHVSRLTYLPCTELNKGVFKMLAAASLEKMERICGSFKRLKFLSIKSETNHEDSYLKNHDGRTCITNYTRMFLK